MNPSFFQRIRNAKKEPLGIQSGEIEGWSTGLLNCIKLKASDEFTGRPTRLTAFEFKVITQIVGAFAKCQPAQIPITNHRNLGPVTKKKRLEFQSRPGRALCSPCATPLIALVNIIKYTPGGPYKIFAQS